MKTPPRVLTIAGSDSGGGAGIQADLRTTALLGCHGSSVITAVTAQNSQGVQGVFPLSAAAVEAQLESVLSDIGTDAAKTGMLFSAELIHTVARALAASAVEKVVVDPVMVAKGGASLLREDACEALIGEMLPLAALVTPNLPEAEALSGVSIRREQDRRAACEGILEMGPRAVLLKGGHAEGDQVTDVFLDDSGNWREFRSPRIATANTHGTGCTLAAAVASYLARGHELLDAVDRARLFLHAAIRESYDLGAGHGPTNPYAAARIGGHNGVLERLRAAWEVLEAARPAQLIPEVQSNLAEALPGAQDFSEIAAFPCRILRCGDGIRRADGPAFGASRHMAKILLASSRWGSPLRAVMNIRFGQDVLDACRGSGLRVEGFSRRDEPEQVKKQEGSTLEWGTLDVLKRCGYAPDVIYDEGELGKEAMVRVFGTHALEVARRVETIAKQLAG